MLWLDDIKSGRLFKPFASRSVSSNVAGNLVKRLTSAIMKGRDQLALTLTGGAE